MHDNQEVSEGNKPVNLVSLQTSAQFQYLYSGSNESVHSHQTHHDPEIEREMPLENKLVKTSILEKSMTA